MKKFVTGILLILTGLGSTFVFAQQGIPETIQDAIKAGDARELAENFNENIALVILDKDDVYSKSQAEVIVKDFFNTNVPESFTIKHHGGTESKYAIGTLKTRSGSFRVYFLIKTINGRALIHQFRIEQGNE